MTLRFLVRPARLLSLTALTITPLLVGAPALAQQATRTAATDTEPRARPRSG